MAEYKNYLKYVAVLLISWFTIACSGPKTTYLKVVQNDYSFVSFKVFGERSTQFIKIADASPTCILDELEIARLPRSLIDTAYQSESVTHHSSYSNDSSYYSSITIEYDSLSRITHFAHYPCLRCSYLPRIFYIFYNKQNLPIKIFNHSWKHEIIEIKYDKNDLIHNIRIYQNDGEKNPLLEKFKLHSVPSVPDNESEAI